MQILKTALLQIADRVEAANAVMAIDDALPRPERRQFRRPAGQFSERNVNGVGQRGELMLVQFPDIQQDKLLIVGKPLGKFQWCHDIEAVVGVEGIGEPANYWLKSAR